MRGLEVVQGGRGNMRKRRKRGTYKLERRNPTEETREDRQNR